MLVSKVQLRATSSRDEDREVFDALRAMGVRGYYDPERSQTGEIAFMIVAPCVWAEWDEKTPAELTKTQIEELKKLSAVEDVILAS